MALHYLMSKKRDRTFSARLSSYAIVALRERGCVVSEPTGGVHTVTSSVPFGQLVTKSEWSVSRKELAKAVGIFLFFKSGVIVVAIAALKLSAGKGTMALWFFGWLALSGTLLPEARGQRHYGVAAACAFFLLGWLVCALGWSTR